MKVQALLHGLMATITSLLPMSSGAADADWCGNSGHTTIMFLYASADRRAELGERLVTHLERDNDKISGSWYRILESGQVDGRGWVEGKFSIRPDPDDGSRALELTFRLANGAADPGLNVVVLLKEGAGTATETGFHHTVRSPRARTASGCAKWPQAYFLGRDGKPGKLPAPRHTCEKGFVWREADPYDRVCVSPEERARTAAQNRDSHLYEKDTGGCKFGYFSRNAVPGDKVCGYLDAGQSAARQNQAPHYVNVEEGREDIAAQHHFCSNYGVQAASEGKTNSEFRCGNDGARWQVSRQAHEDWCRRKAVDSGLAVAQQAAQAESDARKNAILRCELKRRPGVLAKVDSGPIGSPAANASEPVKERSSSGPIVVIPPARTPSAPVREVVVSCRGGRVWREATPSDRVCVTPASRNAVARENSNANANRAPGRQDICASGFVWREAAPGDTICVRPPRRDEVRAENRAALSRLN